MTDIIHHHAAMPYTGEEGDAFDVIESNGEISIYHRAMCEAWGFTTAEEAENEAEDFARGFDLSRDPDGAIWLQQQFEFEYCAECGRDHRHHTAVFDPFGNWFARCDLDPVIDDDGALVVNPEGYED